MDSAKIRVLAGIGGILFGFAGVAAIVLALGIALAGVIGPAWAAVVCASLMIAVACTCTYIFLQPDHSHGDTPSETVHAAAQEALVDIPMQALIDIVDKRPVMSIAVSLAAGFLVMEQPEAVRKQIQRLVSGLI